MPFPPRPDNRTGGLTQIFAELGMHLGSFRTTFELLRHVGQTAHDAYGVGLSLSF